MSDPGFVHDVVGRFAPGRSPTRIEPLGSGHIHTTLRAVFDDDADDLVLQRLNEEVFPDLAALMHNLVVVTRHLRGREAGARSVLEPVPTPGGELMVRDGGGGPWRAFRYLRATHAHDIAQDDALARTAAFAFGRFAALLADLDPATLEEPIANFHALSVRLEQLRAAARADECGRLAEVSAEAEGIGRLGDAIVGALDAGGFQRLPPRVVHNDCKLNNLLFDDETDEPLCVVDLDTVMAGSVLVDFGELVRTAACPAAEDEPDLTRIVFSPSRFEALASGYLDGLGAALSGAERGLLWAGPPWMAVENAARFLADYLSGDRYFRTGDNCARARAQWHLAHRLWEARSVLRETIDGLSGGPRTD